MRLIRGSLFYSVPSSQHQESFTAHLSGLEKHTQELSQADKASLDEVYFALQLLESNRQLYLANRMEDWASLGQYNWKPDSTP